MNSLGIRVSPKEIYFCVVTKDENHFDVITVEKLIVPQSMILPDSLNYIRTNFLSILEEYEIDYSGIKLTERIAQKQSIERVNIEGVIQELFSNSKIESYFSGCISELSFSFQKPTKDIKAYINGGNIPVIKCDDWNTYLKEHRECILVAIAGMKGKVG